MKHIQHSVRLSPALDRSLSILAEQLGLTRYETLKRAVEQGLAIMIGASSGPPGVGGVAADLASLAARFVAIEALLDRSLFVSSAAYCYSRRAALHSDSNATSADAELGEAALAAYQRQRALAAEALS